MAPLQFRDAPLHALRNVTTNESIETFPVISEDIYSFTGSVV